MKCRTCGAEVPWGVWERICPQCGARYPSTDALGVLLAIACVAFLLLLPAAIADGGHNVLILLSAAAQAALVVVVSVNIGVLHRRRKVV